jgi:hypothetical protein
MPRQKVVNFQASVANNSFVDIQPGSGATWLVFSIECGGTFELRRVSGTNTITLGRVIGKADLPCPSLPSRANTCAWSTCRAQRSMWQ